MKKSMSHNLTKSDCKKFALSVFGRGALSALAAGTLLWIAAPGSALEPTLPAAPAAHHHPRKAEAVRHHRQAQTISVRSKRQVKVVVVTHTIIKNHTRVVNHYYPVSGLGSGLRASSDSSDDANTKRAVLKAIVMADAAESAADRTLNTSSLSDYYTGDALDKEESAVEQLGQQGIFLDSRPQLQQFQLQGITVAADGQSARVRLTEVWNTAAYSVETGRMIGSPRRDVAPQTVYLRYEDDGWKVYRNDQ